MRIEGTMGLWHADLLSVMKTLDFILNEMREEGHD